MSITNKRYAVGESLGTSSTYNSYKQFMLALTNAYDWNSKTSTSDRGVGMPQGLSGKFYFTENSYFEIQECTSSSFRVNLVTPNGTKTLSIGSYPTCVLNIGTTSNGLGLTYKCMSNTEITDNDYYNPNFYFGKVILSNGSTSRGCIYVAHDNSYIVATDEGISTESTFTSIIDSTRKGFLVPVTDSTHGAIFKDIYMMACAPVQYNKFKIADISNKYLAGKAICLAD